MSLLKGMKIEIREDGEKIDSDLVLSVEDGGDKVKIKSLELYPEEIFVFARIPGWGWKMLFKDSMTGATSFSERAPFYELVPVT